MAKSGHCENASNQKVVRRRYNGVMRIAIAVAGRVFVRWTRARFDDHLELLSLAGRNVPIERLIEFLKLDHRDESRRSWAAVEAEYRFLICAAGLERSFGRLCVF